MQQLYLTGKRRMEWQEIPDAVLEAGTDAVVRPLAVARCDLEPTMLERGYMISRPPIPLGHEFTGVVIEVGPDVKMFRPGDRIVAPFEISCGDCRPCRKGRSAGCESLGKHAVYGLGRGKHFAAGALANRIRVPFADHMLLNLPENVDAVHAASLSDNVVEGWRAVGPELSADADQSVLILGGGARSVGLYTAATAKALGAAEVVYVDYDRSRLEIAERLGVTVREGGPEWPESLGSFDLISDSGGTMESLRCAIHSAASGAVLTSPTVFMTNDAKFPLASVYDRSLTFRTGFVQSRDMLPPALELIASGKYDPALITTLVVDFEDAIRAWGEDTTKVIARGPVE